MILTVCLFIMGFLSHIDLTLLTFSIETSMIYIYMLVRTGIVTPIVYIINADYLPGEAMSLTILAMSLTCLVESIIFPYA